MAVAARSAHQEHSLLLFMLGPLPPLGLSAATTSRPQMQRCKTGGCRNPLVKHKSLCIRCQWLRFHKTYKARLPLGPGFPGQSWITMRESSKGVGCKACEWFAKLPVDTGASQEQDQSYALCPYVQFSLQTLKFPNIRRHAKSCHHKHAVSAYRGHLLDQAAGKADAALVAPSEDEFLAVWQGLGSSSTGSSAKIVKQSLRKSTTMEWCLWEALRDSERLALSQASTIALAMDERKGRLLVSFAACSGKGLDVTTGFLGQLQHQGMNSVEVAACVRKAVRRLCTRRQPHPCMNRSRTKPTVVARAEHLILKRIEMITADGAANEQLALKLLHPMSARTSKVGVGKLPGLKLILRDKAHASRRLTERTFRSDPLLQQICDVVLFSKNSIAKLLCYSGDFADIFAQEVRQQTREGSAAALIGEVKNLSFAKQRFDSTAKPLGRCLWNLDALISTCHIILERRQPRSEPGKSCTRFIDLLSEEVVVLLGMLADASDECLLLTRFFDQGMFEVANMSTEVLGFKQRLNALFGEAELCLETGFTNLALKVVERSRLLRAAKGMYRSLGGLAPPAILVLARRTCLPRMKAWRRLVLEVVDTEFPDYELLGAFSVFRLQPPSAHAQHRPAQEAPAWDLNSLARLAEAFGVDKAALIEQFQDHRRVAQTEKAQRPHAPAACSWQRALHRTQAVRHAAKRWPVTALLPVLQRFVVCPGSTSGIEHAFSKFKRLMGEQWHGSDNAEERRLVLRLKAADTPQLPPQLLRAARRIWAACFGPARLSGPLRRPSLGVKHSVQVSKAARNALEQPSSAAAWMRKRRRDVAAAATAPMSMSRTAGTEGRSAQAPDGANQAWTAAHEQEAKRQQKVRVERACAAVLDGTANRSCLLAVGASSQALHDFTKLEQARQRDLEMKWRRQAAVLALPEKVDLSQKRLFIEEGARAACGLEQQWRAATSATGMVEVRDHAAAQVFVVLDPSAPGDRSKTVASMVGGMLCTPGFLLEQNGRGAAVLQLFRALSMPRFIFVSKGTESNHKPMVELMKRVCGVEERRGKQKHRWQWFYDRPEERARFLQRRRLRDKDHASEMVTLVTPSEQLQDFPRQMPLRDFLASIQRVDRRCTRVGYCQR